MTSILSCFHIALFVALILAPAAVKCQKEEEEESVFSTHTIALAQISSSEVGNFDYFYKLALEAKANGAEMIVFPEAFVFGWLSPLVFNESQPIPGKFSDAFASIAKHASIWIAAGLSERGKKVESSNVYYDAYDSGIIVDPQGNLVLHHQKYEVLRNAFDPNTCLQVFGTKNCNYTRGDLSDISVIDTPFGTTSLLVCSDTYTYDTAALDVVKKLRPDVLIVPWGVTANVSSVCGTPGFIASEYAAEAALYLDSSTIVVGANGVGNNPYGKYQPSYYCGASGYALPNGTYFNASTSMIGLAYFDIPSKSSKSSTLHEDEL